MKLGIIARCDNRGLGNQTWEAVRNLHPERVLLVRSRSSETQGFKPHLDRFPDATVMVVDERHWTLERRLCLKWLRDLDVVYTAETFYDDRFPDWARELGVATVCHANPEFYREGATRPTVWWSATPWRSHTIPGVRIIPMPCPVDRWEFDSGSQPHRLLHVGGNPANLDRNGSRVVVQASQYIEKAGIEIVWTGQGRAEWARRGRMEVRDVEDYWEMYAGVSAMLLPRRYGGLCLPAIEACGAGLALLMPKIVPNEMWPIVPLAASHGQEMVTPGGKVGVHNVNARQVADTVIALFSNPEALREARCRARDWALGHSWEQLAPLWRRELEYAVEVFR